MSWDKTINALAKFLGPVGKYLGMWTIFAALGTFLVLAGFGVGYNESRLAVSEGTELAAIVLGSVFLIIATFLFKTKLEKMNGDSCNTDKHT